MPFLDSLDIGNRALQLCGVNPILAVDEDSPNNFEVANAYDKVRRAELRRNVWRFAVKKAVIRALDTTTLLLVPALYSASDTYLIGEVVRDVNGLFWISQIADNINNVPGGNNEAWDAYFGPATVSLYDSTIAYAAGEVVYKVDASAPGGYRVFLSLISGNSDEPATVTAYDATVQYKQDDVVAYSASQWRSLLPVNEGNTPADGYAAWDSGTTYSSGAHVTGSNQRIYTSAVSSNTGNDPTTDDGTNWTQTADFTAWSRTSIVADSSINWRPLIATLKNLLTMYPIGAGPFSQSGTRNIFRLPCGYLRQAPDDPKAGNIPVLGAPSGLPANDWNFDGDYIVSAETGPIILRFVADITQVRAMDDMFCEGLSARVATAVCERLTQSTGKLQTIASAYKLFMGEARLVSAIEQGPVEPPLDPFIAARA